MGTWLSGITSGSHAEGHGFKSKCVHLLRPRLDCTPSRVTCTIRWYGLRGLPLCRRMCGIFVQLPPAVFERCLCRVRVRTVLRCLATLRVAAHLSLSRSPALPLTRSIALAPSLSLSLVRSLALAHSCSRSRSRAVALSRDRKRDEARERARARAR